MGKYEEAFPVLQEVPPFLVTILSHIKTGYGKYSIGLH